MGRALRVMHNLKIRQPLAALHLVTKDEGEKGILAEMADIITEELNVKKVIFRENEEELVEYSVKPNYKILGKQFGKYMKEAAAKIENFTQGQIKAVLDGAHLTLEAGDVSCVLTEESLTVGRKEKENLKVLNQGSLTVALDPVVTQELKDEGMVRDLVRSIQNLRKETGLEVTDRITLTLFGSDGIKNAVESFNDYLMSETLAQSYTWDKPEKAKAMDCGDETCFVSLERQA